MTRAFSNSNLSINCQLNLEYYVNVLELHRRCFMHDFYLIFIIIIQWLSSSPSHWEAYDCGRRRPAVSNLSHDSGRHIYFFPVYSRLLSGRPGIKPQGFSFLWVVVVISRKRGDTIRGPARVFLWGEGIHVCTLYICLSTSRTTNQHLALRLCIYFSFLLLLLSIPAKNLIWVLPTCYIYVFFPIKHFMYRSRSYENIFVIKHPETDI